MSVLLPGATIGVIGGGQLARMMSLEARRMGYRVCVVTPQEHDPAAPLADEWIAGTMDDVDAGLQLAAVSDVITVDSEHVPASLLARLEEHVSVRPSAHVLRTVQDRRAQREFLASIDVPQPECLPVETLQELDEAARQIGLPCVLKTRRAGYDGKGQAMIHSDEEVPWAWERVNENPCMLEKKIAFDSEISVLLARNPAGEIRFYPIAHNMHRHHVLHATVAPAPVPDEVENNARHIAGAIAEALDLVGMLAVELFLVGSELLVNEIAPRPHNSGHYTFSACATSQFEQHVRAISGLALGDTTLARPAVMVNLLGDLWKDGEPDWTQVLSQPEVRLHLYGKVEARPGRKMGHILLVDDDADRALQTGEALLETLTAAKAP